MIDYIKVFVKCTDLNKLTELVHRGVFTETTIETDNDGAVTKETYNTKNMLVDIRKDGYILSGSIHKYHSQMKGIATEKQIEQYNGNNSYLFTYEDFKESISNLCQTLDIEPQQCNLQNIEFGLNVPTDFEPKTFLEGFLFHKNDFNPTVKHNGNYIQFNHQQYYLKVYNKGKQYETDNNILRVEVKVIKTQKLKKEGVNIITLADINEDTLKSAFDMLLNEFQQVVYYDYTTRENELTDKERQRLDPLKVVKNWENMDRFKKLRNIEFLQNIFLLYSDFLKNKTEVKMHEVYNDTMTANIEKCNKLTDPNKGKNIEKCNKLTDPHESKNIEKCNKLTDPKKNENATNLPFKYSVNLLHKPYIFPYEKVFDISLKTDHLKDVYNPYSDAGGRCAVTKFSLLLEGENAKYIRTKTILHLKKYFLKEYSMICSLLLPNSGYQPTREKNITLHLCKQIRNRFNQNKENISTNPQTPLHEQTTLF